MNNKILIENATVVNENKIFTTSVKISNQRIEQIGDNLSTHDVSTIINADGLYLIPGIIDDQVHFREPGNTHKATIGTESIAAVAGGTTTIMDMPNTNPQTTTIDAYNEKIQIGANSSLTNYGFFFGATNSNLEEIKQINPSKCPGIKVFMGSSTGNMLVDNELMLESIFKEAPTLIATHCEDQNIIKINEQQALSKYGENVPVKEHFKIRSHEACLSSSKKALELAEKFGANLHILHLSTKDEVQLLSKFKDIPLKDKKITAEVCIPHLTFTENDYDTLGTKIKCNPAVKTEEDQKALIQGLKDHVIDIIATDHAPHLIEEKNNSYFKAPSGIPMIQHTLMMLIELYKQNKLTLTEIVNATSHNVATRYHIKDRGFIREGYFADLVLLDINSQTTVTNKSLYYKCKWSPLENRIFTSKIITTFVNGYPVYNEGYLITDKYGLQLNFDR